MLLAFVAFFSSAFACGPYGDFVSSEDGSFAIDNGSTILLYNADGSYAEIPVEGEVVDMDYVGEDLVVAFEDEDGSLAVLFAPDGEDLAEWIPRRSGMAIRGIEVLSEGLVVTLAADKQRHRVRLTDDLQRVRSRRAPVATPW